MIFKPDIYVKDIIQIDYEYLEKKGIKLLCFDLDNTLDVPDKITKFVIKEIDKKLIEIDKKFEILIISNNAIRERVKSFCEIKNYNYISSARKPFQKEYKKSKIISKYPKNEIAFIGDKIVTDVIGGNLFGSMTILVDPILKSNKHWYSVIMNISENFFSFLIRFKRGRYYNGK